MGRWVTLDDDQKVFISDGGKVLATRSAISKASGGTERGKALAGRSKAAILKGGRRKTEGGKNSSPPPTSDLRPQSSVKSGSQALRDMYAAKSRHASLQGKLDAGDKSVTKEHVAQAREELRVSRVELLRTKLHQEKQQVEQTAAKPPAPTLRQQADASKADKRQGYSPKDIAREAKFLKSIPREARLASVASKRFDRLPQEQKTVQDSFHPPGSSIREGMVALRNKNLSQGQREAIARSMNTTADKIRPRVGLASPQPPARAATPGVAKAAAKPTEAATIGHKPGESFSLIQRSAARSGPSAVNTGKGSTKFMFDMNKRDLKGQTSMFDKPAPAAPKESARTTAVGAISGGKVSQFERAGYKFVPKEQANLSRQDKIDQAGVGGVGIHRTLEAAGVAAVKSTPSLRDQASAARAAKGTTEERVAALKAKVEATRKSQYARAGRADMGPPPASQRGMSPGRVNTDRVYARRRLESLDSLDARLKRAK